MQPSATPSSADPASASAVGASALDLRSLTGARWLVLPVDEDRVRTLTRSGMVPAAARTMAIRGFDDGGGWLSPSLDHLHDPFAMDAMGHAVERIRRAARDGERVRIITDYDVDGTTSSLILQAAMSLAAPRVQVDYHIPDRFTEGYGFSVAAAEQAAADGVDLVVTADIGVRDHAAVAAARAAGLDVLVCDHHLPDGADVPADATVLCPPKAGCDYPNRHLAACGVTTKLAQALLADHPKQEAIVQSLLKLAAIGTVADLVPLRTLENRAIVSLGLLALNHGRHSAGLKALLDVSDLTPGEISETELAFRVGPRINAAGRIARATHVVELLTTRDPVHARRLAKQLDGLNRERREVQKRLVDTTLAQLDDPPPPFVVVSGTEAEGYHRGVVGIVAARLKDKVHRPVAVVSIQGDRAVGSVRSVPGVHAVKALDAAADLLVKYGGHPAAAGFTVPTEHLDTFTRRLCAFVDSVATDDDLVPEREADAEVRPHELDAQLLAQLRQLGPFGMGNPEPRLLVRGAWLDDVRPIGRDRTHLKAKLRTSHGPPLAVLWWRHAHLAPFLQGQPVDLLGELGENVYRGRRSLQLVVRDARPAQP